MRCVNLVVSVVPAVRVSFVLGGVVPAVRVCFVLGGVVPGVRVSFVVSSVPCAVVRMRPIVICCVSALHSIALEIPSVTVVRGICATRSLIVASINIGLVSTARSLVLRGLVSILPVIGR